MSLIIATGTNLGSKFENLARAKHELCEAFELIASSQIYHSKPVEFENQPIFFNQVLEFKKPQDDPFDILEKLLSIEKKLGRVRKIHKGPRIIDLDILFLGLLNVQTDRLTIPHPRWKERSFVVNPLAELPFFNMLKNFYSIPQFFNNTASPISKETNYWEKFGG